MACCGNQRTTLRQGPGESAPANPHYRNTGDVIFEYSGNGQLTVTGPLTGTVYRFSGTGARLRVNGPDAPSLVSVPNMRPVR